MSIEAEMNAFISDLENIFQKEWFWRLKFI